ncbi:outer membrane transport energization protein ExbB [Nitrospirillum amazonense]|uniref:Biopolymer transport protein ExbB n=1 Tax=Nitrospirillum amazonense TaxID=28077 RepID=A0A560FTA7_9PROT|nr:tonB-system energizer ExbB [Nitrospirillum amazonense]TWB24874.1 outer membrane transport energization protein ExbB [Nitrospirillum amazonense]
MATILLKRAGLKRTAAGLTAALGWGAAGGAWAQEGTTRAAAATVPHDLSAMGMFLNADGVVKAVILGLLAASVVTWTILLAKGLELRAARGRLQGSLDKLDDAPSLDVAASQLTNEADALALAFARAATAERAQSDGLPAEGVKERVVLRLERLEAKARRAIVRGTGILATIGATAPFVGLFGTVWGIMNSFIGISKTQTTSLAVVAPGIAEALLATATGLVAAIPAVVVYNVFARKVDGYRVLLADVSAGVLRLVSRDLDRAQAGIQGAGVTLSRGRAAE